MISVRRQLSRLATLAFLAGVVALAVGSTAGAVVRSQRQSAGSVHVVGYTSEAALRHAVVSSGSRVIRRIRALHVAVLRSPPAALRLLSDQSGIRYSGPPVVRRELADPGIASAPVLGGAYEWQYAATRAPFVPANVVQAASAITIAVIDTGADLAAPDLAAKAPAAWSVRSSSSDVTDYLGHGTFVSSLAAGSPTNAEGIAGFGGEARLLVVQAAGIDGTVTDVDEAAAIVYAVDHGAQIINMSFGGPATSAPEQSAVAYAASHGVLMVAAAGNSGQSGNAPNYPAALLQRVGSFGQGGIGLAVAASSLGGGRASFSNYGSNISLAAPGENVFGALSSSSDSGHWPRTSLPGSALGIYGYGSGTSFSSPEVAGAAALVWAANPGLRATDIADILKQTASGAGSWNQDLGYGVIDVASAVARAEGVPAVLPAVNLDGRRSGLRINLSWTSPGAVSYRLSVKRDTDRAHVLLGATNATSASYELEPGHSYSFTVTATDPYGRGVASTPYVVSLPYSSVKLDLRASSLLGRTALAIRLWGVFSPASRSVARGSRKLVLESYDGNTWRRFSAASTSRTGIATWTLVLRRGTYRIRARYAGTDDLSPATSRMVTVRVR